VAAGMRAALHLSGSVQSGSTIREDALPAAFDRADALVSRIPIAGSLEGLSVETLTEAMQTDKKRDAERLQFVVLNAIGVALVTDEIPPGALEAAWNYAKAVCRY